MRAEKKIGGLTLTFDQGAGVLIGRDVKLAIEAVLPATENIKASARVKVEKPEWMAVIAEDPFVGERSAGKREATVEVGIESVFFIGEDIRLVVRAIARIDGMDRIMLTIYAPKWKAISRDVIGLERHLEFCELKEGAR